MAIALSASGQTADAKFEGKPWVVESYFNGEKLVAPDPDSGAKVQLRNGVIDGGPGCGGFVFGEYSADESYITINTRGWILGGACFGGMSVWIRENNDVTKALNGKRRIENRGSEIFLYDDAGRVQAVLGPWPTDSYAGITDELERNTWTVTSYKQGGRVIHPSTKKDRHGRKTPWLRWWFFLSGSVGCGSLRGGSTVSDGRININVAPRDMDGCSATDVKTANAISEALTGDWRFKIKGRRLTLLDDHGAVGGVLQSSSPWNDR